jgi:hypothetical protein
MTLVSGFLAARKGCVDGSLCSKPTNHSSRWGQISRRRSSRRNSSRLTEERIQSDPTIPR